MDLNCLSLCDHFFDWLVGWLVSLLARGVRSFEQLNISAYFQCWIQNGCVDYAHVSRHLSRLFVHFVWHMSEYGIQRYTCTDAHEKQLNVMRWDAMRDVMRQNNIYFVSSSSSPTAAAAESSEAEAEAATCIVKLCVYILASFHQIIESHSFKLQVNFSFISMVLMIMCIQANDLNNMKDDNDNDSSNSNDAIFCEANALDELVLTRRDWW